jgi:hypothetical protein
VRPGKINFVSRFEACPKAPQAQKKDRKYAALWGYMLKICG